MVDINIKAGGRYIKYFETYGLYWIIFNYDLNEIIKIVKNNNWCEPLYNLSRFYFERNSINPGLSVRTVADFLLEHINE